MNISANLRPSDTEENVDLISSRTELKLENINGRKADCILSFLIIRTLKIEK